jgi:hypothetical protein
VRQRGPLLGTLALVLLAAACGGGDEGEPATSGDRSQELVGLFRMTAGKCDGGPVSSGSYFRMVQPGGTVPAGPFVINGDSPCGDKTWTPLSPGNDGGLRTGRHQPHPTPAFDPSGNAVASAIARPQAWFAVRFALATNPRDPQTGTTVAPPRVTASGSAMSGDLRAWAAAWNGQHFNQGSPKPDGMRPGGTSGPRGTYDASSRAYTLEWSSQIVGGPFNNFTGMWHLEGTFEPGS